MKTGSGKKKKGKKGLKVDDSGNGLKGRRKQKDIMDKGKVIRQRESAGGARIEGIDGNRKMYDSI